MLVSVHSNGMIRISASNALPLLPIVLKRVEAFSIFFSED